MTRKNIIREFAKTVVRSEIDFGDMTDFVISLPHNFNISSYTPKERILPTKTEKRIHFDDIIEVVYQGKRMPLTYRVVYTAGQEAIIHFLRTTREERRIIQNLALRERLKKVYDDFIYENVHCWLLVTKINNWR